MGFWNKKNYNGVTDSTLENIVVDSGAIFKNFTVGTDTYDTAKTAGKLLGATQGGSEFTAKVEFEDIEIDGVKVHTKGFQKFKSATVELKVNVLEQTLAVIKSALATGRDETVSTITGYSKITADTTLASTDFIENITLVAKLSGSETPVIVQIYNALSTDGLGYKFEDGKEAVSEITFSAYASDYKYETLPFAIWYPTAVEESEE